MNYIGIDLGTTNSAISVFDGQKTRIWKNKQNQGDVTPSAIYVDKRGKRFYGAKAYNMAAMDPDGAAVLFKRFMGTKTMISMAGQSYTPQECSAEILRELFRNLPEETKDSTDNGVVITVPAAFNQMQNAATVEAAKMAHLGDHVTLVQEPVAAVMSVMQANPKNGRFLIYDLGGGTLDIAIADSMDKKVNLLAHGGIAMCGGRDFDRIILHNKIIPWIDAHYHLPDRWDIDPQYKKALRIAEREGELAKIILSSEENTLITIDPDMEDLDGQDMYMEIPLNRDELNLYMEDHIMESVRAAQDTIHKAGLRGDDFDRIVFVGGPTNYKPLRDKVSSELGIPYSIEVNPMTAVAEGASIFAESIDWSKDVHERKLERGVIKSQKEIGLSFRYMARTAEPQARIIARIDRAVTGYTFRIASVDTGWDSGTVPLADRASLGIPLMNKGENQFVITVYDVYGREISLDDREVNITYMTATIGSILASHSVGVEIQDAAGNGNTELEYLIKEGYKLPVNGEKIFRAGTAVHAGSEETLNFKLWEGDIDYPVEDNLFIGCMTICGKDFDFGTIHAGDPLVCRYIITEAGSIELHIFVSSIDENFSQKNFYSRTQGEKDWNNSVEEIVSEAQKVKQRLGELIKDIGEEDQAQILEASEKATDISTMTQERSDPEKVKAASEDLIRIKKIINIVQGKNKYNIRQGEVRKARALYNELHQKQELLPVLGTLTESMNLLEHSLEKTDQQFDQALNAFYMDYIFVLRQSMSFQVSWFHYLSNQTYAARYRIAANQLIQEGNKIIQQHGHENELDQVNVRLQQFCCSRDKSPISTLANITRW